MQGINDGIPNFSDHEDNNLGDDSGIEFAKKYCFKINLLNCYCFEII